MQIKARLNYRAFISIKKKLTKNEFPKGLLTLWRSPEAEPHKNCAVLPSKNRNLYSGY